ncbi:UbiA family prenyltransferase [Helicobacter sp. 11S02596-1]|uniref:UbiA family prenyltransferase n=1 Tax=Helicobacter sp. 11S02596-1 TaxID=1476194 RepID=UPI002150D55F|nr:UbiA family prenyltransferase [Helicobacter sp. 11S02596-1]
MNLSFDWVECWVFMRECKQIKMELVLEIKSIFHLMRFYQYIKNFFIFLPAFFSFKLFELPIFFDSLLAFVCFCLCASAVYIFNDIMDVKKDKIHPVKRHRPIASGKITPTFAGFIASVLLICGGGGGQYF